MTTHQTQLLGSPKSDAAPVERMRIDSSGNVGIGTTSPAMKLDVTGGGIKIGYQAAPTWTTDSFLWSESGVGLNIDGFNLKFNTGASRNERMRIDSSGNVGIGTNSPASILEVSATEPYITISSTASQTGNALGGIRFDTADPSYGAGGYPAYITAQDISANGSAFGLVFGTQNAERMRINHLGNVGIGTSSPKTRLQSSAGGVLNAPSLGSSSTNAPLYLTNNDTAYGLVVGNSSAEGHVWLQAQRTDGTATAYNITLNEAGGNVGIGTSSPAQKLSIESSGTASSEVDISLVSGTSNKECILNFGKNLATSDRYLGRIFYQVDNNVMGFWTNKTERMRIDTSGNLKFNSGYGSVATAYGCRAWVNFNGQGTVAIRGSGNVSSITDNGTGDYTVNFTTAMSDANYSAAITASDYWRTHGVNDSSFMTASSFRFKNAIPNTAALNDPNVACVTIFR
jgi:hypothetical protein